MLTIKNIPQLNNCQKENKYNINKNLSNLFFSFPHQGLIFITGESMKQNNLFKILTYQKKIKEGEIWISDKNINFFNNSDIAFFYNFIIGIFSYKEFFFIDDLTVKDNIKIYLELQNKIFNTKKIKEVLQEVDLISEIELDSLVEELTNEQKQKLMLAILILKDCNIIVAFKPGKNSNEQTKKNFLIHFEKLSQNKLVIIFVDNMNEFSYLADQILIITNDGIKINQIRTSDNQKKFFNFELIKRKYSQTPYQLSDSSIELLSLFLFDARSLPIKLRLLSSGYEGFFYFRSPLISCTYTTFFSIFAFVIICCYKESNFLLLSLSLLILVVFVPLIFMYFCWWKRIESQNTSVLNKKKFYYLQKIGMQASDMVTIFKIDTFNNLDLELTTEIIFNTLWTPICLLFMYYIIKFLSIDMHPIVILVPLGLVCLITPFVAVPLIIKKVVKKRVKKDLYQEYYNYL